MSSFSRCQPIAVVRYWFVVGFVLDHCLQVLVRLGTSDHLRSTPLETSRINRKNGILEGVLGGMATHATLAISQPWANYEPTMSQGATLNFDNGVYTHCMTMTFKDKSLLMPLHTYTLAPTHTHIHTHTHTYTHTHNSTHTQTATNRHTQTYTCTNTSTHIHTTNGTLITVAFHARKTTVFDSNITLLMVKRMGN